MNRREFISMSGMPVTAVAVSASAGVASGQDSTTATPGVRNETESNTPQMTQPATSTSTASNASDGPTQTVSVGPGGALVFAPGTDEPMQITPGTTVRFVWESDNHNIVVDTQPTDASWSGHDTLENEGFTYSYTFETLGTYDYYCEPHRTAGMGATIEVVESIEVSGGAGGEKELHDLGVPIQAHWVGAATILGIIVTVIFTFYVLKYGESAHTGTGRNQ